MLDLLAPKPMSPSFSAPQQSVRTSACRPRDGQSLKERSAASLPKLEAFRSTLGTQKGRTRTKSRSWQHTGETTGEQKQTKTDFIEPVQKTSTSTRPFLGHITVTSGHPFWANGVWTTVLIRLVGRSHKARPNGTHLTVWRHPSEK